MKGKISRKAVIITLACCLLALIGMMIAALVIFANRKTYNNVKVKDTLITYTNNHLPGGQSNATELYSFNYYSGEEITLRWTFKNAEDKIGHLETSLSVKLSDEDILKKLGEGDSSLLSNKPTYTFCNGERFNDIKVPSTYTNKKQIAMHTTSSEDSPVIGGGIYQLSDKSYVTFSKSTIKDSVFIIDDTNKTTVNEKQGAYYDFIKYLAN